MKEQIDFIAIGDTVTDEFIELEDVRIDTDPDKEDKGYDEICFRFGDKVGYKNAKIVYAVGNSANAAVSATRLGLKTAFITDIGTDELGKKKKETLEGNGVDCTYVEMHEGMKSNHHYVLRKGPERTILIKHWEYPYALPKNLEEPKWFYMSSVGEHGLDYHFEIAKYLQEHPNVKLAFQPGTFQIKLGASTLADLYKHTHIFFCNREEAGRILETKEIDNTEKLLKDLTKLGPKIVIITDGPAGAFAYDSQNSEIWFVPMYPDPKDPVDRTGAGDSFSSTVVSALALDKSLSEALLWGPVNSMNVVQYIGAQEGLLKKDKLKELLKNSPADYKVKKLS